VADFSGGTLSSDGGALLLREVERTSDHSAAQGVVPALEKIVAAIRKRGRQARIMVRGDSGFGWEELRAWCEGQFQVYYWLGLAKNSVLVEKLALALADARARRCRCGAVSVRVFRGFEYRTQKTWSQARRVIGKAEVAQATAGSVRLKLLKVAAQARVSVRRV